MVAMHFEVRNFLSFFLFRILVYWYELIFVNLKHVLHCLVITTCCLIIDQSSSDCKRKVVKYVASIASQRVTKGLNNVEINKEKPTSLLK